METQCMGFIERGRIAAAAGGGYTVESLDRAGIVSPPIGAIGECAYSVGDTVLFVLFPDGTGKIICSAGA